MKKRLIITVTIIQLDLLRVCVWPGFAVTQSAFLLAGCYDKTTERKELGTYGSKIKMVKKNNSTEEQQEIIKKNNKIIIFVHFKLKM